MGVLTDTSLNDMDISLFELTGGVIWSWCLCKTGYQCRSPRRVGTDHVQAMDSVLVMRPCDAKSITSKLRRVSRVCICLDVHPPVAVLALLDAYTHSGTRAQDLGSEADHDDRALRTANECLQDLVLMQ